VDGYFGAASAPGPVLRKVVLVGPGRHPSDVTVCNFDSINEVSKCVGQRGEKRLAGPTRRRGHRRGCMWRRSHASAPSPSRRWSPRGRPPQPSRACSLLARSVEPAHQAAPAAARMQSCRIVVSCSSADAYVLL